MSERRIGSFAEFWPFYVGEHRSPIVRGLHYFGTSMALLTIAYAVWTRHLWVLPAALVVGYGPAWIGHFFIEQNRPATFKYPLWSLRSDFRMLALALRGRMAEEVTRLYGSPAPARDAPLRVAR
jgi:hypothetical protein